MKFCGKEEFLARAVEPLGTLYEELSALPELSLAEIPVGQTVLVVIDMNNGFAKKGALSSPRVGALIEPIAALAQRCAQAELPIHFLNDSHGMDSPEFDSFPTHCLAGDEESEVVDELKRLPGSVIFPKNSTNALLEPAYEAWLTEHPEKDTFIIAGDCTDLCVAQFACALKCRFNRLNRRCRVIVATALVDTFDSNGHQGDLFGVMALAQMRCAGVELCANID